MFASLVSLLVMGSLASAETFKVMVGMNSTGGAATVFTPNQVTAQQGDRILFIFRGKNHTVTQSSFAEPCTLQFNTVTSLAGVDSGFMPVAANASELPTFEVQINDATSPQWFFCNQASHCNNGMVFAVNAPTSGEKSFDAWVTKAKTANHPDPALNQTAPFTPPTTSGESDSSSSSSDSGASSPTDVPVNAAPEPSATDSSAASASASASATNSQSSSALNGLTLSRGSATGTSEADRVVSSGSAAQATVTTSRSAAFRLQINSANVLCAALALTLSAVML